MAEFSGVDLVGTTGTLYKEGDIRAELAFADAEAWRDAGRPLVVVDASPFNENGRDWVGTALRERDAIVLRSSGGRLASQRMQGIAYALEGDAERMVTHEPEKPRIARYAGEIVAGLSTSDILVIGRTEAAKASMPPVQRWTERVAGLVLEKAFDFPEDALCGPRAFTRVGAEELARYPVGGLDGRDMDNWIYMYYTPLEARAKGLRIGGIALDLIYPKSMVDEETGNEDFDRKRIEQFRLQLDYLMQRDDVKPEAAHIADAVLTNLDGLDKDLSLDELTHNFSDLEDILMMLGVVST